MTDERNPQSPDDFPSQTEVDARVAATCERQHRAAEEHERRLREDPAYRADFEARQRRSQEWMEAERRENEAARRRAIAAARADKGIPRRFWPFLDLHRRGGDTNFPDTVRRAHDLVDRFGRRGVAWSMLILAGPPGVGKTTEAAWYLDEPYRQVVRSPRWNSPGEVDEKSYWVEQLDRRLISAEDLAKASLYDEEYWSEFRDRARLVVDDLGVEQLDAKGYALGNIISLLSHRHAHSLPTLITTNLRRADFERRYGSHDGGRFLDRLKESAHFEALAGPSLRRAVRLDGDSLQ